MQPPSPADLRAWKARLDVTYQEIADAAARRGHSYSANRFTKVLKGHEKSAPVRRATAQALERIEADRELHRRAACGDRDAQDLLDEAELAA